MNVLYLLSVPAGNFLFPGAGIAGQESGAFFNTTKQNQSRGNRRVKKEGSSAGKASFKGILFIKPENQAVKNNSLQG